jgi:hypothetical protein
MSHIECYIEKVTVARKEHRCEVCREPIPARTKYTKCSAKWDGKFDSVKMHEECLAVYRFIQLDVYYNDPDEFYFQDTVEACKEAGYDFKKLKEEYKV